MHHLKQHPNCKRLKNKRNNTPDNELSAKRAWRRFNKKGTRKACYKLQQGLCAYTELSLDSAELGNHLEHIAPRSRFPERTFLADNLVLSVLADDYSGPLKEEQRFAGHYKKSQYADDWFISPYDQGCEKYFEYSASSGEVNPAKSLNTIERSKAEKTISALNLNCAYLVNERLRQLTDLEIKIRTLFSAKDQTQHNNSVDKRLDKGANDEPLEGCFSANNVSSDKPLDNILVSDDVKDKLEKLMEKILQPADKKLPEFYTAKKQLLQHYKQQLS